jgi:hypothetical protein
MLPLDLEGHCFAAHEAGAMDLGDGSRCHRSCVKAAEDPLQRLAQLLAQQDLHRVPGHGGHIALQAAEGSMYSRGSSSRRVLSNWPSFT